MQALLVGLPAGRGVLGCVGVGLLDSVHEMDREVEEMGEWGKRGEGTGVGATADFRFPAAYVCVVSMCSDPLFPSLEAASLCDLCEAPVPLCIHWKISSLHKNCLKNEICDYILFISGLR